MNVKLNKKITKHILSHKSGSKFWKLLLKFNLLRKRKSTTMKISWGRAQAPKDIVLNMDQRVLKKFMYTSCNHEWKNKFYYDLFLILNIIERILAIRTSTDWLHWDDLIWAEVRRWLRNWHFQNLKSGKKYWNKIYKKLSETV